MKSNKILLATLGLGLVLGAGSAFADGTAAAPAKAAPAAKPAAAAPAAKPAEAVPAASTAAKPAAGSGSVSKAQFTSAVTNHEATDNLTTLDNSHTRIFFYCVLNGFQGQEITFRWSYNDVTQAEVKQTPAYPHYRTQTSKELDPSKLGTWKVEVMDSSGNVLTSKTFDYTKAEASTAPAASTK